MIKILLFKKESYSEEILLQTIQAINPKIKVMYNLFGKPITEDDKLYFNISHSGAWVAVGIADKNIGIDIQKMKSKSKDFTKYVTGNENTSVLQFIKIWTIKESFIKWTGCGWSELEPDTISVDFNTNIVSDVQTKAFFVTCSIKKEYILTVCCNTVPEIERIFYE